MKYIIGFILTVAVLLTLIFFTLQIWDIHLFDPAYITQTWYTIAATGVGSVLLIVLFAYFFKRNDGGYDRSEGNRAHPKR